MSYQGLKLFVICFIFVNTSYDIRRAVVSYSYDTFHTHQLEGDGFFYKYKLQ